MAEEASRKESRFDAEVQKIFSDQGETILHLGRRLAKAIPPKNPAN